MNEGHCRSFNPKDYANSFVENRLPPTEKLFEKKFTFKKHKNWILPGNNYLYTSKCYQFDNFQELKIHLNNCKSKLNDNPTTEWSQHTRRRNPAGDIPYKTRVEMGGEFVTQAWCKFYECLCSYPLVNNNWKFVNSLHLCEAPGAFITALNHYLKMNLCKINVSKIKSFNIIFLHN